MGAPQIVRVCPRKLCRNDRGVRDCRLPGNLCCSLTYLISPISVAWALRHDVSGNQIRATSLCPYWKSAEPGIGGFVYVNLVRVPTQWQRTLNTLSSRLSRQGLLHVRAKLAFTKLAWSIVAIFPILRRKFPQGYIEVRGVPMVIAFEICHDRFLSTTDLGGSAAHS